MQFAGLLGMFLIVALLWLRIIYLPARTVEKWEGERPRRSRRDR